MGLADFFLPEVNLCDSFCEFEEHSLDCFDFLLVVVDVVVPLDPLIGGLALGDEVEVVAHEDEEGEAHDGAHHYQEEEDGLGHEEVLQGDHPVCLHHLSVHVELHRVEVDAGEVLDEAERADVGEVETPDRVQSQEGYEVLVVLLPHALSDPTWKGIYQMQWWSNLLTHILHTEQCLDLAGLSN